MKKKTILAVLPAMMLIGGMSCGTGTQNKEGGAKPGAVAVDVVKLTGIVKAIDRGKKMVTVEGSGGRTVVIDATNARNLDQLKVGDRVNLTYVEEVALFVRKSDQPPSVTESQNVELAPKGEKPGGVITKTTEVTGNVESIDTDNRTIALKGPAGNVRAYKVGPEAKNFDQIRRGDQVVLRVTEALALSVGNP
jgi:Cu/Ag efflux protein CusF